MGTLMGTLDQRFGFFGFYYFARVCPEALM